MIALLLLLAATGQAQDNAPGGYRLSPEVPVHSAALRPALVVDPAWAHVAQLSFDGRVFLDPWAITLQHPWVFAWRGDGSWSDAAPGVVRLGASRAMGKKPNWLGLDLTLPVVPHGMAARSWGSVAQETLFGAGARLQYEHLWPLQSPISLRLALGVRTWSECGLPDSNCGSYKPPLLPDAELIAARSWMVTPGWAVVTEHELLFDPVPTSSRLMLRRTQPLSQGTLVADLGLQAPLTTYADYFSLQLVAQLRWYPEGIELMRQLPPEEP